ncbi:PH domain-containing protein [Candidatus Woesebacteria bacterium]|nr:MAG: PH domain-containing protein [Candidatus Woesebacteria bacterium]
MSASATREKFPLSYKKVYKKTLSNILGWVIFTLILWGTLVAILGSSGNIENWIMTFSLVIFTFLLLIVLISFLYQRWYYYFYFYDLADDYIQIKKGPITPREITLPYERIQDVYVDQDILDRIFGIYDIHVSSATISSGVEAHIDGVEKQSAEGLRATLLETVKQRISKNRATPLATNLKAA